MKTAGNKNKCSKVKSKELDRYTQHDKKKSVLKNPHEEQAQTGRPGRTRKQKQIIDPDLLYATVDKTREHL